MTATSPLRNPLNTITTTTKASSAAKSPKLSCFLQVNRPSKSKILTVKCDNNHPQNLSLKFLSGTDHIIQSSSLSLSKSVSMAAASAQESASKTMKRVCLFYCDETKALAERVAAESDAIELRAITWRKFEDGFPNLFIPNAQAIRGQHVAFLASFSSPQVIFEQLSIIYALPKLFISSFTLVLPFFPTGTSERMEDEGDVATAFTLARILSNIPTSRGGPTSLVIFDIHALQERFYFGDNILPFFESGIPLLKNRLQQLPDSDNIAIAFPDDGAWKRFHNQLQHFPMIVCAKVREGNQRIVRIKEGDPQGRHVVIVDDLVQSGGTLIECQKVLADHGAARISAYVTHGIFPNRSWERFEFDNGGHPGNGLTYFWITDSCPSTVREVMNKPPFEVLSLASSIAAALQI
ncbi:ribose-phosphate pyrophosphokinase 4 [Ricinus communis]|uniref:ribose-phosphate diphosphokinase n=1 Tax=Ricinus communis TaxID=3988 RepID=B9SPJ7_RICCO|nr:ribose-phosphate pyrophosphokinase 4 [Ricinus communis]EEF34473.1 Ribose-phosphate pyrophosphokinase, putative [Ricinus communis]|eukprot:XP_002527916.1 ribose-phosphate pyrophosphokinase 4 [Ricinus communis]